MGWREDGLCFQGEVWLISHFILLAVPLPHNPDTNSPQTNVPLSQGRIQLSQRHRNTHPQEVETFVIRHFGYHKICYSMVLGTGSTHHLNTQAARLGEAWDLLPQAFGETV